jgi:hypothetical protein
VLARMDTLICQQPGGSYPARSTGIRSVIEIHGILHTTH